METAHARLDPDRIVGPVSRRIFGGFVEHMGRGVYTGIYEPGHPAADADGFRGDVLALIRELGVTVVRYPGGNFVSGYRWEDGVGPRDRRPTRLDLAWRSVETNEFGLDEFIRWTRKAGVEPMLAVNLGTRGLQEALDLVEYANHPAGTALADLRAGHGAADPYGVRIWCLGNEVDGSWQLGHKEPREYARLAAETARALRQFDPGLELVACGSSNRSMPTFGAWEEAVLEEAGDLVDFISLHAYFEELDGDLANFLASAVEMDRFIADVGAIADRIAGARGDGRRVQLSVDEWNVWYLSAVQAADPGRPFAVRPRISEEPYTLADAVVVGNLLISLLRHADRVTAACLAQLVNTIAPIHAEPGGPAWRKTSFHPFSLTAAAAHGNVLALDVRSPATPTATWGEVSALDAIATHEPEHGRAAVFAVNRSPDRSLELRLDLSALGPGLRCDVALLADPDPHAAATAEDPERVLPRHLETTPGPDGILSLELPPVSWVRVRIARS